MLNNLTKDQLALAELMSQISEAAYSAAWMDGLEFVLWTVLNGGSKKYGVYTITENEIHQLQSLADKCGCWIVFDDENEETAVGLEIWKQMYLSKKTI